MNFWQLFWSVIWFGGLGVFTILTLIITVHGARDLKKLLHALTHPDDQVQ